MRLQSLTLRNIRSYVEQTIDFPEGKVLLAGDIGSGKSTILLSIEFALFGLLRGDVEGAALLRAGAKDGSVTLSFTLDKQYTIHRVLKRSKETVAQDAGWLETDGVRQTGTAQELKAWLLEILGYPSDFLSKSKSLLFRYTVFTPQEEMKRILFEDSAGRVDTLRRVFGVDTYKRVKDNSAIYVRHVREERKKLEGMTADVEAKTHLRTLKQEEEKSLMTKWTSAAERLVAARAFTQTKRTELSIAEASLHELAKLNAELTAARSTLQQNELLVQRLIAEQRRASLLPPPPTVPEAPPDVSITLEPQLRNAQMAVAQLRASRAYASGNHQKIVGLGKCPTCLQFVTDEHKHTIASEEATKLQQIDAQLQQQDALRQQLDVQVAHARAQTDLFRKQELEARTKKAAYEAAQHQLTHLNLMLQTAQQQVETAKAAIIALEPRVQTGVEEKVRLIRATFDAALASERQIELEHARTGKELEGVRAVIISLDTELREKEVLRKKLQRFAQLQNWLSDHFAPLLDLMEQHVLAKVHHEFNSYFQQWFGALIEDALLTARLDAQFTPVIHQNGYEVDLAHLSGGEKTACALAYRLALNKVINDVVGTIRTKDLLILDEPTDGFSSEQLDKLRDVLEQLRLRQVLLVSHEQKVESMVDAVIRVSKDQHRSTVSS
jgi:DNA repair exonuclease SbcCD ATPase subunit